MLIEGFKPQKTLAYFSNIGIAVVYASLEVIPNNRWLMLVRVQGELTADLPDGFTINTTYVSKVSLTTSKGPALSGEYDYKLNLPHNAALYEVFGIPFFKD
jgi:hypothetical protein